MSDSLEAWNDFRRGERVTPIVLPCCECGKDSRAYASFDDMDGAIYWLCEACVAADQAAGGAA